MGGGGVERDHISYIRSPKNQISDITSSQKKRYLAQKIRYLTPKKSIMRYIHVHCIYIYIYIYIYQGTPVPPPSNVYKNNATACSKTHIIAGRKHVVNI